MTTLIDFSKVVEELIMHSLNVCAYIIIMINNLFFKYSWKEYFIEDNIFEVII